MPCGNSVTRRSTIVCSLGTELGTTISDSYSRSGADNSAPLNYFNPYSTPGANYSQYPPVPALGAPATNGSQQDQYAVYLQDMIQLTPYFKALLGVRANWVDQKTFSGTTRSTQAFDAVTPRYGLVFEPIPEDLSYYVSYSETFNVINGFAAGPTPGSVVPLDPESGWGFDVGTKARLRDNLYLTVGYFDIERTNVAQAVPNSVPPVSVQFGMVRSTGMEIELMGQVTERWSIVTGYGMADARIERDRVAANVGTQLPHAPMWQGSLWSRYNFIQNEDRVVGMGLGMYYTDDWAITSGTNQVRLPSYQRYDMGLFHDIGRWRSALFIENLLDQQYASGGNTVNLVVPGTPLSVRATLGVTF
ncbi:MAG: TonB-dependent receptor [Pirellulales bacterium]